MRKEESSITVMGGIPWMGSGCFVKAIVDFDEQDSTVSQPALGMNAHKTIGVTHVYLDPPNVICVHVNIDTRQVELTSTHLQFTSQTISSHLALIRLSNRVFSCKLLH